MQPAGKNREMKHTPGPWRVDYSKPSSRYPVRVLGDDGDIAYVVFRGKLAGDFWEANARLIAAAPEMVAFIQAVEPLLKVWMDEHPHAFTGKDVLTEARALLAKIEGKE